MNSPSAAPASSSSFFTPRSTRGRNAAISAAASVNRNARNRNTLACESALLTTTNVAPHSNVHTTSAMSALTEPGCELGSNDFAPDKSDVGEFAPDESEANELWLDELEGCELGSDELMA